MRRLSLPILIPAGVVSLVVVWQASERSKALVVRDRAQRIRTAAEHAAAPTDASEFWKVAEAALADADAACYPFNYSGAGERYAQAEQIFGNAVLAAGVSGEPKEVRFGTRLDITFAPIRPGIFRMGPGLGDSVTSEGKTRLAWYEERKRRPESAFEVELTRSYWISVHEVTRAQFGAFVEATKYVTTAEQRGWTYRFTPSHDAWHIDTGQGLNWRNPGFMQDDDHPVVGISWNDATAFCRWFGQQTKRQIRLPTEAEWEFACRAGSTTPYANGDTVDGLRQIARISFESWEWVGDGGSKYNPTRGSAKTTQPVGSLRPNALGLFDMHGNASEWCQDTFAYYPTASQTDYVGGTPQELITLSGPTGPLPLRVHRGGGWAHTPNEVRSASREGSEPHHSYDYSGFRLVLDVPTSP